MERYHGTVPAPTGNEAAKERCTMFTRTDAPCRSRAVWSVLFPMHPGSLGGGWERPVCGGARHLTALIEEASERYDPGEPIEVRRLADA